MKESASTGGGSFDFSSFLVATVLFLLLMLVLAALFRFIHRRFFLPMGIPRNSEGLSLLDNSRFVVETHGRPAEESYKAPPFFHVSLQEKLGKFKVEEGWVIKKFLCF